MDEKDKVIDSSSEKKVNIKLLAAVGLDRILESLDLCQDVGNLIGDIAEIFLH